jgi:surface antigen
LFIRFFRSVSARAAQISSTARFAAAWQRCFVALALALSLIGAFGATAQPAYAYNCVNVVLRDPYWGQYRRIVESGWNAAGIGSAFARSGFAVNNWPQAGDIMVWPGGYYGASRAGHVGVVAAVYGNGTVLVLNENWPMGTAAHYQVFAVHPAHQFVHRAVYVAKANFNASTDDEVNAGEVAGGDVGGEAEV